MRLLMQEVFDKHCVAECSGSLKQSSWQKTFANEMMPLDQYTEFCIRLGSTSILSACFLSRGADLDLFMIVGERCRPNRMPNFIVAQSMKDDSAAVSRQKHQFEGPGFQG